MLTTSEKHLQKNHRFNCRYKVKLTPEEAAQSLWSRPKDHGFDIYICTNCNHLHFGHNRTEKIQLFAERNKKNETGKAIHMLCHAVHHLKKGNRFQNKERTKKARDIITNAIKQLTKDLTNPEEIYILGK